MVGHVGLNRPEIAGEDGPPPRVAGTWWAISLGLVVAVAAAVQFLNQKHEPTPEESNSSTAEIVVALQGTDDSMVTTAAATLEREFRGFPDTFEVLSSAADRGRLKSKGLYQRPAADVHALAERWQALAEPLVVGTDPIHWNRWLSASTSSLSASNPVDSAEKIRLLQLADSLESLQEFLEPGGVYRSPWTDPTFERTMSGIEQMLAQLPVDDHGLHRVFVQPLAATPSEKAQAVRVARDIVRRVGWAFPSLRLQVEGAFVAETDALTARERSLIFGAAAWVVFLPIMSLVLTRFAVGALAVTLTSLLSAAAVALATQGFVPTVGTTLFRSLLLIVPATALLPLLWVRTWTGAVRAGRDPRVSANEFLPFAPASLAASLSIALALALSAVLLPPLPRVATWMAALALLFSSSLTSLWLVPLLDRWVRFERIVPRRDAKTNASTPRRWKTIAVATLLVLASLGWLRRLSVNVSAVAAKSQASEPWAWVTTHSLEEARRLRNQFNKLPTVERVHDLTPWLPADPADHRIPIQTLSLIAQEWQHRKQVDSTSFDVREFRRLLRDLAQSREAQTPADQILWDRISQQARKLEPALGRWSTVDQARRMQQFERLWLEDLGHQFRRLAEVSSIEPICVADLPARLRTQLYRPTGEWVLQIEPKETAPRVLAQFRKEVLSVAPFALGRAVDDANQLASLRTAWFCFLASGLALAGVIAACTQRSRRAGFACAFLPGASLISATGGSAGLGLDLNLVTFEAWSLGTPLVMASAYIATYTAIGGRNRVNHAMHLMLVSWGLMLWTLGDAEFARIGFLIIAGSVCSGLASTLSPSRFATEETSEDATVPVLLKASDSIPPARDLPSTVYYHDAA